MIFDPPLIRATLTRRYKRFLADVTLESGAEVPVHCPNPGAMTGLNMPGLEVWVQPVTNPKAKLPFSWKLVALPGGALAGIDTGVPNRIVGEALRAGRIPALAGYDDIRAEVPYADASRVDFLLRGTGRPDCYLEVKNVHLARSPGLAEFPDCVTTRGARHMHDLARMVAEGHRAVLLYVVQHDACSRMALAGDIDPAYAQAARDAHAAGVALLCHGTRISREGIALDAALPIDLP